MIRDYSKIKFVYYIIIMIWLISLINPQINESEFLYRVKTSYYSLQASGIKNYSSWITSDYFKENSKKNFTGNDVYPLELIWISPDKLFFIKRSLPEIKDTTDYNSVNQLILDLLQEIKGIYVDWQRFIGTNLLFNLPKDYLFSSINDTIKLEFQITEKQDVMNITIFFGKNGLCFKIISENLNTNETLYTYPKFDYLDNKWLCSQWQVQIQFNNEITGGFLVRMISEKIEEYYLPVKIVLLVQSKEKKDKIFKRTYNFRNIMVNRDLQILEK
jgi:hypothetical protein